MNLLAGADPRRVAPADIAAALEPFRVRGQLARRTLKRVWQQALETFLADNALSDAEATYLEALRACLGLTQAEVASLQAVAVHPRFEKELRSALADGLLTAAERAGLDRLQRTLRIPDETAHAQLAQIARDVLAREFNAAMSDQRLSPYEEKKLAEMAASMGVELAHDEATQFQMHRYSLLWNIENGHLPAIQPGIALKRGEVCHWSGPTEWRELRTRTTAVRYSGPAVRVRIMKGLYWRAGSVSLQRVTREELTTIDRGTLHVTNKRLVFDGGRRNTSLSYSSVIGIRLFSDAIEIEKANGRSPYFMLDDTEIPAAIISAALASSS